MTDKTVENILQQLIILNKQTAEMLYLCKKSMRDIGMNTD